MYVGIKTLVAEHASRVYARHWYHTHGDAIPFISLAVMHVFSINEYFWKLLSYEQTGFEKMADT